MRKGGRKTRQKNSKFQWMRGCVVVLLFNEPWKNGTARSIESIPFSSNLLIVLLFYIFKNKRERELLWNLPRNDVDVLKCSLTCAGGKPFLFSYQKMFPTIQNFTISTRTCILKISGTVQYFVSWENFRQENNSVKKTSQKMKVVQLVLNVWVVPMIEVLKICLIDHTLKTAENRYRRCCVILPPKMFILLEVLRNFVWTIPLIFCGVLVIFASAQKYSLHYVCKSETSIMLRPFRISKRSHWRAKRALHKWPKLR